MQPPSAQWYLSCWSPAPWAWLVYPRNSVKARWGAQPTLRVCGQRWRLGMWLGFMMRDMQEDWWGGKYSVGRSQALLPIPLPPHLPLLAASHPPFFQDCFLKSHFHDDVLHVLVQWHLGTGGWTRWAQGEGAWKKTSICHLYWQSFFVQCSLVLISLLLDSAAV